MHGLWSGYEIKVTTSDKYYKLKTKTGVRGINIPVTVNCTDGKWSAMGQGMKIEVIEVVEVK